jgi:hypothetical protein
VARVRVRPARLIYGKLKFSVAKLRFFSPRVFGGTIYHAIANTSYCGMKWFPLVR